MFANIQLRQTENYKYDFKKSVFSFSWKDLTSKRQIRENNV